MTRLPERLPAALSERIASASSALFSRQGREVDVAIGGIPFRLATYNDIPQTIETITVRKDQVDQEADPGEQSLSGWWRRSQASWHEGAGNLYQEQMDSNQANHGFYRSEGVDVLGRQGSMTLLRKMEKTGSAGATNRLTRIRSFAANGVRTNLCVNPSLETDASSYIASGGDNHPADAPSLARITSDSFVGSACLEVTWGTDNATGFPPQVVFPVATIPNGQPYTCSARVKVPAGSPHVSLITNEGFGTTTTVNDQWVTLTVSGVGDGSNQTNVQLWPATPVSAGQKCRVDTVIIEAGTVFGPYFDGTSPNAAWNGTAHLSTSTETITATSVSLSAVGSAQLWTATNFGDAFVSLHAPVGKTIIDGVISGTQFYDVATDGTLYSGNTSAPGSATTWPCGVTPSRLAWGKHRLWMIGGTKLWQPNLSLAGGSTQNPIFTHPNTGWTYTSIAEGPTAMYFGGHDGFTSSIQAVTLDSGGAIPTLSGATVTAVLPDGELVQELAVVAGQFIGIGTNRGFRVGVVNADASITYGPLLIEPEDVLACTSVISQGKFFLVGFRTTSGRACVYKVDTSTPLQQYGEGVYPYAKDVECDFVGAITSMVAVSDQGVQRVAVTTSDGQPWHQSADEFVDSGWLETGRIRFRTNELKSFKYVNVEIEPLEGSISVDLIKEGGSTLPLGSITQEGQVFSDSFGIDDEAMRYASLKFTLTPDEAGTAAPSINSYLLRALPAVAPMRMITLPLLCFDQEQARSGQRYGGQGYAKDRLLALQILEDSAETVLYQDYSDSDAAGEVVTIEAVQFIQTNAAPPYKSEGAGGILVLKLRTLTA